MNKEFNKLHTEAGERLIADPSLIPWREYPRPHLKRAEWLNLNGRWELETESGYGGPVRVPFPIESSLSGFNGELRYGEKLTYRRTFTVPDSWRGRHIKLNLGAVSREHTVFVNGSEAGNGHFAYFPLSIDITEFLRDGENELKILCINDLDPAFPYGKQKHARGGMWYTPCSGIWQTVWLEPVPEEHIFDIRYMTRGSAVEMIVEGVNEGTIELEGKTYPFKAGKCRIELDSPRLWSPEEPNLYEFTVRAGEDEARSYFALRTVETKTVNGTPRLCLNGKPYFFNGLLDQGYFSDGLWTPAEPSEYERDILKMKSLGFNMLRKHIKIEPELFYYYCDKLGMAVFQDMVNNGKYNFGRDTVMPTIGVTRLPDKHINVGKRARFNFLAHMRGTVALLCSHPSIVYWTIFNEGWGQFKADEAYAMLKKLDDTRPIDPTSGWFRRKKTDVDSLHIYFKKLRLGKRRELPQVLSEFGGYVWKDEAHSFNPNRTYGYKILDTREDFVSALRSLYSDQLLPLVKLGLSAAVYTQVSDVEDETNGILTYDRRVMKLSPSEFADISEAIKYASETN